MPGFLLVLLAVVPLFACGRGQEGRPARDEVDGLNVIWVVLDAASARHLGHWGATRPTSPKIDDFAQEGVSFDRAYAQWPATLPSTGSFLTGRYPPRVAGPWALVGPTISTLLHDAGWRTAAFSENPFVSRSFGFSEGFDEFHEVEPVRKEAHPVLDQARRDTARTVTRSLEWIDANSGSRYFLYLHLLPPHPPYAPPPPFGGRFREGERYDGEFDGTAPLLLEVLLGGRQASEADLEHLRALYDENIAYVDHQVGRLIQGIRDRGLLERTIVVLSSDHGEAFGQHGTILHGTSLYEEQIHVPLVIRFPPQFQPLPKRWRGIVELVDIVPTLLDALGIPYTDAAGRSLLKLLRANDTKLGTARAWLASPLDHLAAIIRPPFKLIVDEATGERELYDLDSDPLERNDLSQEVARAHLDRLEEELKAPTLRLQHETVQMDPKTAEQLEALGYVGD